MYHFRCNCRLQLPPSPPPSQLGLVKITRSFTSVGECDACVKSRITLLDYGLGSVLLDSSLLIINFYILKVHLQSFFLPLSTALCSFYVGRFFKSKIIKKEQRKENKCSESLMRGKRGG